MAWVLLEAAGWSVSDVKEWNAGWVHYQLSRLQDDVNEIGTMDSSLISCVLYEDFLHYHNNNVLNTRSGSQGTTEENHGRVERSWTLRSAVTIKTLSLVIFAFCPNCCFLWTSFLVDSEPITSSSDISFLTKEREVELKKIKNKKTCKNKLNEDENLIGHYMNMCQSFGHVYLKPFSIKGRVSQQ